MRNSTRRIPLALRANACTGTFPLTMETDRLGLTILTSAPGAEVATEGASAIAAPRATRPRAATALPDEETSRIGRPTPRIVASGSGTPGLGNGGDLTGPNRLRGLIRTPLTFS